MIMKNCDESIEINCNPNCPYIDNHLYANYLLVSQDQAKVIVLILNCTSIYLIKLFNLIKNQQKDTGKSYLYAKDSFKPKNQLLFN